MDRGFCKAEEIKKTEQMNQKEGGAFSFEGTTCKPTQSVQITG